MLRENFAAIVSHELKSPLGALQQNLFALSAELEDKLSEEQKQRFERLTVRLEDLVKLIHSWLRILSVDINKLKETFQPVSLPVVVSKAIETIHRTPPARPSKSSRPTRNRSQASTATKAAWSRCWSTCWAMR
jgi:signal transduction histidine kinase